MMKLFIPILVLFATANADSSRRDVSTVVSSLSPVARALFPADVDDSLLRQRRLELDCTAYLNPGPEGFGNYSGNPDGKMEALDTLREFRGQDIAWYDNVMDAMMIVSCENKEENQERYVADTEATADCDSNALDSAPETGYCERKKNCYWSAIVAGQDRGREYTDEEFTAAKKTLEEYATSVAKYLAGPIVAAVLNFLFTLMYFCFRCICRLKCCGARPRMTPYKSWEISFPVFFFAVFAFAMIGTANQANVGNNKVTTAFERIFDTVDKGAADLMFFFGTAGRPVNGVANTVQDAVDEVNSLANDTDWVSGDMNGIVKRFSRFASNYNSTLTSVGQAAVLNDVVSGMNDTVGPIVEDVEGLLDTLSSELIDVSDMIQDAATDATDQLTAMNDTIAQLKEDMDGFRETQDSMSNLRQAGVLALFAVAIVFVILGFIGVISAFTPCKFDDYLEFLLHFTWLFGSVIGTIAFIIGGVALVLSVAWSDMCVFMDIVKDDFSILGEQAGKGLNACYNDTALLVAFNMTDQLDFAGPLEEQLAATQNISIADEFAVMKTPVTDMGNTISAITLTDIGGVDLIAGLAALTNSEDGFRSAYDANAAPGAYDAQADSAKCCYDLAFAEANILTPWVGQAGTLNCDSTVSLTRSGSETAKAYIQRVFGLSACSSYGFDNTNIHDLFDEMYDTIVAKNGMLADLGTDATFCASNTCPTPELGFPTTIMESLEDYEAKMGDLMDSFDTMGQSMVGDLVGYVNDFTCNMRCGFLAAFMDELQDNWCKDLLSGFLDIALSLVLLACFNVPVCICAAVLVNRFRGKWRCGVGSLVLAGADEGGRVIGSGKYEDKEGGGEAGGEGDVIEMPVIAKEEGGGDGEMA